MYWNVATIFTSITLINFVMKTNSVTKMAVIIIKTTAIIVIVNLIKTAVVFIICLFLLYNLLWKQTFVSYVIFSFFNDYNYRQIVITIVIIAIVNRVTIIAIEIITIIIASSTTVALIIN